MFPEIKPGTVLKIPDLNAMYGMVVRGPYYFKSPTFIKDIPWAYDIYWFNSGVTNRGFAIKQIKKEYKIVS